MSTKQQLKAQGIGDCWRVVIEQWNSDTEIPDAIGYIVAPCAADAAEVVEAAYATNHGPMTRVKAVEYVGPAWEAKQTRKHRVVA